MDATVIVTCFAIVDVDLEAIASAADDDAALAIDPVVVVADGAAPPKAHEKRSSPRFSARDLHGGIVFLAMELGPSNVHCNLATAIPIIHQ